jgi:hypothetical protein
MTGGRYGQVLSHETHATVALSRKENPSEGLQPCRHVRLVMRVRCHVVDVEDYHVTHSLPCFSKIRDLQMT